MNLAQSLAHTSEVFEPKTFSALREQLDPDWITKALEATDTVTVRRRRLPAQEMIWSVVGMALLRDRTITDVARSLSLDGRGPQKLVSGSAVSQARSRLGKEPLAWLFSQSAKVWSQRSADQDRFKGLALYGVDGTSLRVPDTPGNAERFGYSQSVRGESGYPLVRMVALMALRSHVIAAAAFGSFGKGEHSYAENLWSELPGNSLCIVDRGFFAAKLLLGIHDEEKNKHWLIRLKSNAQMKTLKALGPADMLVEVAVSKEARRKDTTLPSHYTARAITYQRKGFKPQRVLTSLTDHRRYPAAQVAALYHERWELEIGYDEIKTDLLDRRESIRSKNPDGVEQEIWGLLLAYNLVRTYIERVAAMAKLPPLRISFITALRFIREEWYFDSLPGFAPGSLPRHMRRLAEQMSRFVLPERRSRPSSPRAVKIKMSNYPRKRRPGQSGATA